MRAYAYPFDGYYYKCPTVELDSREKSSPRFECLFVSLYFIIKRSNFVKHTRAIISVTIKISICQCSSKYGE